MQELAWWRQWDLCCHSVLGCWSLHGDQVWPQCCCPGSHGTFVPGTGQASAAAHRSQTPPPKEHLLGSSSLRLWDQLEEPGNIWDPANSQLTRSPLGSAWGHGGTSRLDIPRCTKGVQRCWEARIQGSVQQGWLSREFRQWASPEGRTPAVVAGISGWNSKECQSPGGGIYNMEAFLGGGGVCVCVCVSYTHVCETYTYIHVVYVYMCVSCICYLPYLYFSLFFIYESRNKQEELIGTLLILQFLNYARIKIHEIITLI